MALKITSLVWERGPKDHTQFVVHLALAEFADHSGLCWPSIETIATRSRLSKSSVIRTIKRLETDGWLSTVRKSREHKGNTYRIALDRLDSRVSVTPDLFESSPTVTPELPQVRCHPGQSQVSPSAESGVTEAKPPDPLKGGTVKNRHEPKTKGAVFIVPPWLPLDCWNASLELRHKNKKDPTEHAKDLVVRELDRLRGSGQDPGAVLDQSTMRCYTGVFPVSGANGNGTNHAKLSPGAAKFKANDEAHEIATRAVARRLGIAEEDDRLLPGSHLP